MNSKKLAGMLPFGGAHVAVIRFGRLGVWAACMVIAGCGGGSSDNTTGTGSGGGSTPPPTENAVTLYSPVVGAIAEPAASGDMATDAFNWMNYRRALLGLAPMARVASLNKAAQSHASYRALNPSLDADMHRETQGATGFTGVTVLDRTSAAGYGELSVSENISFSQSGYGNVFTDFLVDAPYHRMSQLGQWRDAGAGWGVDAATGRHGYVINFGALNTSWGPSASQVLAYPYAGQTNAPTVWTALETPNPVLDLAGTVVGYPISLQVAMRSVLSVSSMTLSDSAGSPVPSRLITSRTDNGASLNSMAFIVPLQAMAAGASYTVAAKGSLDGRPMDVQWSFRTQAATPMNVVFSSPQLPGAVGSRVTANWTSGTGNAARVYVFSSYSLLNGSSGPSLAFATVEHTGKNTFALVRTSVPCDLAIYRACVVGVQVGDATGSQSFYLPVR